MIPSPITQKAERWVTIGAKPGSGGKPSGGTPVRIDDSGKITAGPAALTGKPVNNLPSSSDKPAEKPSTSKPHSSLSPTSSTTSTSTPAPSKPASPAGKPSYVGQPIPKTTSETPSTFKKYAKEALAEMAPETIDAVKEYTGDAYAALNKQMRSCPPKFECVQGKQKALMEEVEAAVRGRLPEVATVWRGIEIDDPQIVKKLIQTAQDCLESGRPYQMGCITSTSFDSSSDFMNDATIVFRIQAKTGLPVESISKYEHEQELVQSAHTRYKVVAVDQAAHKAGKKQVIYLEEEDDE